MGKASKISLIIFFAASIAAGMNLMVEISRPPSEIRVFAGNDRVMCRNQDLLLNDLNAYIEGDVTDGTWMSYGDGRFQPGNQTIVKFSDASRDKLRYVPGPIDKALGFYRLMLLSDLPVGSSPQERVSDEVRISFQDPPPLFCNTNFTISLNEQCQQPITVSMLQSSPVPPYTNYIITLYDKDGKIIPDNVVNKNHIDTEISFRLGHQCTSNTCWGKFRVEDYFPPEFVCRNDTVPCTRSVLPDSLGFPFPAGAKIDTIINKKYYVSNWDKCSLVTLEYIDEIVKANCAFDLDKTIIRKWKAWDAKGNLSQCSEYIVVKRIPLQKVQFPSNYDDVVRPGFECTDSFPVLANGHPSPDTTGIPTTGHCGNLQYSLTDVRFNLCGASFKIARSWFVIDWCTAESVTRNQIILVRDSKGPKLICQDTVRLSAGAYACATDLIPVPVPLSEDECSTYTTSISLSDSNGKSVPQFIKQIQGISYFESLPLGQYVLEYTYTDQCNNISVCKSQILVSDQTAPYPACDQFTKVALTQDGKARVFAETFDDGSFDNCGISGFRVQKMTDTCGGSQTFGPYVDFCCLEVGKSIMVALEVSDIHGLKNSCLVEVTVEDKLKPSITCPPNLSVSCDADLSPQGLAELGRVVTASQDRKPVIVSNKWHQGIVGLDGLAGDNCSVSVSDYARTNLECYTGTVKRTFIATDNGGRKDSCIQTIQVLDPAPFSVNDITWPANVEMNGCKSIQSDTSVTGQPLFKNTSCALVSATWDDQIFSISDGACVKIVRTWSVINWCQFSGIGNAGRYGPYTQLIKLHNTDKPTFTKSCADTTFCAFDPACLSSVVVLTQSAVDPCTAENDLKWQFSLDVSANGTVDQTGNSATFTGNLPYGKHSITWRVEDNCGNFNTCTRNFEIKDCKNPSVFCISSLTASLKQATGNVQIWAKDFDKGSFDHCTPKEGLIFTFNGALPVNSLTNTVHYFDKNGELRDEAAFLQGKAQKWLPDSRSSALYFDCENIPDGKSALIPLSMTVTDSNGNADHCDVALILQDNSNHCPDVISSVSVSGRILTENGKVPKNTRIVLSHQTGTDTLIPNFQNGAYSISQIPVGSALKIEPFNHGDPLDGLSTLDLILIQRHILGLAPLTSPFKIIAADVNGTKSVTASDLVDLRKLILGINSSFPKNMPSWLVVASGNGVVNSSLPSNYSVKTVIDPILNDTSGIDFTAIKLGDVNLSANGIFNDNTENRVRNVNTVEWITDLEIIQNQNYLTLRSAASLECDGFQLFLDIPDLVPEESPLLIDKDVIQGEVGIHTTADKVHVVAYSEKSYTIKAGDLLLAIPVISEDDAALQFGLSNFGNSETYIDQEPRPVILKKKNKAGKDSDFRLQSNPVAGDLVLEAGIEIASGEYQLTIMNSEGRNVYTGSVSCNGVGTYAITLPEGWMPGVYLLRIESPATRQTIRFISIR